MQLRGLFARWPLVELAIFKYVAARALDALKAPSCPGRVECGLIKFLLIRCLFVFARPKINEQVVIALGTGSGIEPDAA